MNDDTPYTAIGDEPVEARIVAWVLGEASAFEVAELERLCGERPELLVFRRRMLALHGLLAEAAAAGPDEEWKLPPGKRMVLEDLFGREPVIRPEPQKERRIRHIGRRALLAIAACLVLAVVVLQLVRPILVQRYSRVIMVAEKKVDFMPGGGDAGESEAEHLRPLSELGGGAARWHQNNLAGMSDRQTSYRLAEGSRAKSEMLAPSELDLLPKEELGDSDAKSIPPSAPTPSASPAVSSPTPSGGIAANDSDNFAAPGIRPGRSLSRNDQPETRAKSNMAGAKASLAEKKPEAPAPMPVLGDRFAAKAKAVASDASGGTMRGAALGRSAGQPVPLGMESGSLAANGDGSSRDRASEPLGQPRPRKVPPPAAQSKDAMELSKAIRAQEDKVEDRRKVLSTIVRTKGVIYKGGDSFYGQTGVDEDQGARDALQTYHKLEQDKQQLESQISSLLKYDSDQLMVYASGVELPDNIVRNLYPQYQEAKRQLADLQNKGLKENHPTVKATADQIQSMKRQMDAGVVNLRTTLMSQLDVASNRLKGVAQMKDSTREEAIKRGLDAQDYVDAKRDFEKDQEILQTLKQKQRELFGVPEEAKPTPKLDPSKLTEESAAADDPYSTFSLNISDASFQVARAALAKGERPDPAAIKVEQFYNAVDYGDPSPSAGEPVAVAIEQAAHPVIPGRNLVRVALKTSADGRSASQPLRLTLLVDQSGSMARDDRRAAMDKALGGLAGLLTPNDLVTVIGFARTPRLLADGWSGGQAAKLNELVNQAASEGGTNLEEALKLAGAIADRRKMAGAQNRIVLFTDGAANLGDADPAHLAERVKGLRQKGMAVDIAGIAADGLNDELLGELARNGNGRYYVVGKGADDGFARQLAGAFRPAAENVKVQVRFNPERVGHYKLIGFEKDRLQTEDFRNDAVDAAELAADEAGVAIYQVEPLPDGNGELGEVSVRFRDAASGQMVERSWTIPHDAAAPALDRATPSMQLAALTMLAAEKLRGGPLAEAIDFRQLAAPRANVKRFYGNNTRVAEVLNMLNSL